MTIKVGINGFGRVGRNILRAVIESGRDDITVVAINDPAPLATNAHMFEFDSVHGRFGGAVTFGDGVLDVGRGPIRVTSEHAPENLPWGDVDVVMECTGIFRAPEDASRHFENGARKVLLSAPAKGSMKTIVYGVNDHLLRANDTLVSNASCTTNCLAPLAHAVHEAFGIRRGHMTTVHCYTVDQPVHDKAHSDLNRARAAGLSMIPTTTGAAQALGLILPDLAGRITGTAIRVPTPNVSCIDLVVEVAQTVTAAEVNAALTQAAEGMHGVMGVTARPLVSVDFNHDSRSTIIALDQTSVQQGTLVRVLAWYDNEWAFANRMLDTATAMMRA